MIMISNDGNSANNSDNADNVAPGLRRVGEVIRDGDQTWYRQTNKS